MKRGYKECPFCKNEIKKEAIKCQYCKEMLPVEEIIENKKKTKICPFCMNEIKAEAVKCQFCHEFLNKTDPKEKKTVKPKTEKGTTKVSKEKKDLKKESEAHIKTKQEYEDEIREAAGLKKQGIIPNRLSGGKFFLLSLGFNIVSLILMPTFGELGWESAIPFIYGINIIIHMYLASKRYHDMGITGWAGLSCIIPLVVLFLYFTPGDKGDNEYGPAPL